jgi:hypothetical protein
MSYNSLSLFPKENNETSPTHVPQGLFRFPDEKSAPIDWPSGFVDNTEPSGGSDAETGGRGTPTVSWSDSVDNPDAKLNNVCAADDSSGWALSGWPMMSSHIFINPSSALSDARSELDTCDGSSEIDGNGFAKEWLLGRPMMSSHIFISPSESSALSGAYSELDTCDGPSELAGSGFSTAFDPSAGPDGSEIDDGGEADDSSGFAKEWLLGWPMMSSHIFIIPRESSALSGARSGLDTCDGPADDSSDSEGKWP